MKKIYSDAVERGLHVDHIIPLVHPLVCGLHVETNLQAIDPIKNIKKSNRWPPQETLIANIEALKL